MRMTRGELDAAAGRLAARLAALGVGRGGRVGVLAAPGPEWAGALLAAVRLGAAHLGLDPAHPPARTAWCVEDARLDAVVTTRALSDRLPPGTPVLLLDAGAGTGPEPVPPPPAALDPDDLAYVIYTSGSTGRPKGTAQTHGGLANLAAWHARCYAPALGERAGYFSSPAFDVSVWELWGALATGVPLVFPPAAVRADLPAYYRWLVEERITGIFLPTPLAAELMRFAPPAGLVLRTLATGGDRLHRVPTGLPFRVVNVYGPAETTVMVVLGEALPGVEPPPLGNPIDGAVLHVLDGDGGAVPVGVAGELWVGGPGLGRGYLGRPAFTADRYRPDPFVAGGAAEAGAPGGRLYRSGDRVRRRPDGGLDFLGRLDGQLKIRGVRLEPGEVEAALCRLPAVAEAAVAAVGDEEAGGRRLAAWVVPAAGAEPAPEALRAALAAELPDALIPTAWAFVPALPKTAVGKLDRRALPAPAAARPAARPPAPPRTPAEAVLAEVFREVLGIAEVGVEDSFFALGGDSIRAIRVHHLAAARGLSVDLAQLFRYQTVAGVAAAAAAAGEAEAAAVPPPAPFELLAPADRKRLPAGLEDAFPTSRMQEGMLYHGAREDGHGGGPRRAAAYHYVYSLDLEGGLDPGALRAALARATARHPALRTGFDLAGYSEPLQLVHAEPRVRLAVADLSPLPAAGQEAEAARRFAAEEARPFAWERPPLIRFTFLRLAGGRGRLLIAFHHAILDGWSATRLAAEILGELAGAPAGVESVSPPTAGAGAQYAGAGAHYIALERAALGSVESRRFWLERAAAGERVRLPGPLPDEAPRETLIAFELAADLGRALGRLAEAASVPLRSLLLAAHLKALGCVTGALEPVTGLVTHGRPEAEGGERALGLFLNNLPLRLRLGAGSWRELVRRTWEREAELLPHRRFPMAEIRRAAGGGALFDTAFSYTAFRAPGGGRARSERRDGERRDGLRRDGVRTLARRSSTRTSLGLMVSADADPAAGAVALTFRAAESASPAVAGAFADCFRRALEAMAAAPDAPHHRFRPVAEEPVAAVAERPPAGGEVPTLAALFARQAAATPDAPAVVAGAETWSYAELAARAGAVAARLRRAGASPEERIGVYLDRRPELVAAILGVLEAGAAYVPLDPGYPPERTAFMLADSGARRAVTRAGLAARLPEAVEAIAIDADEAEAPAPTPAAAGPGAGALAYVIYTSGSTGRPKGVAIEHRSAAARLAWARDAFTPGERAAVLASTSVCFDLSIFELFVPLTTGGRVVLVPDVLGLAALPPEAAPTLVNTVPSLLAEALREGPLPASVVTVNLAGEALPRALADRLLEGRSPAGPRPPRLWNLYGPSEDTTYSTGGEVTAGTAPPAIGRPLPGTRAGVTDRWDNPVPAGVPGELTLGGAGLARGYLGRPRLTAERFVPDPAGAEPGERRYRTGDLVRRGLDGELRLPRPHRPPGQGPRLPGRARRGRGRATRRAGGRRGGGGAARRGGGGRAGRLGGAGGRAADRARGAARGAAPAAAGADGAGAHRGPRRAAADALGQARPRRAAGAGGARRRGAAADRAARPHRGGAGGDLVGSARGRRDRGRGRLLRPRRPLARRHPPDRAGAPQPRRPARGRSAPRPADDRGDGGPDRRRARPARPRRAGGGARPPRRAVRRGGPRPPGRGRAGRRGGRMTEVLGRRLRELAPERRELLEAMLLRRGVELARALIPRRADPTAAAPLSYDQERLWFLDRLASDGAYNLPLAERLGGPVRPAALAAALGLVAARHEALRTRYAVRAGAPVQVIEPPAPVPLPAIDLAALPAAAARAETGRLAAAEARRRFDLERGPVLRAALVRDGGPGALLLLTVHHVAADGLSLAVLRRELETAYRAALAGAPARLPELPVQYADFAVWQRRRLDPAALAIGLDSLRRRLAGAPALELPADRPRAAPGPRRGARVRRRFPGLDGGALRGLAGAERATPFMVALAAWQALLSRLSGQLDVSVGTPVDGRGRAELEPLIGLFVNTVVLRLDLGGDPPFAELVRRVRQVAIEGLELQEVPFERVVAELAPERGRDRTPLFQVMLTLREAGAAASGAAPSGAAAGAALDPPDNGTAKFDLTLSVTLRGERLEASLEHARDRFDHTTAERWLLAWGTLLGAALAEPSRRLSALPLLDRAQAAQVLREWSGGPAPAEPPEPLAARVAAIAAAAPELPAVWWPADETSPGEARPGELTFGELTYGELWRRSARLAARLRAFGVEAEEPVLLCLDRRPEAIVGALAVLAAGGAYVPVGIDQPRARLARLVEESGARVALTGEEGWEALRALGLRVVVPEPVAAAMVEAAAEEETAEPAAAPAATVLDALAYVIFTSGSTGRPKGVMVSHRAMAGFAAALEEAAYREAGEGADGRGRLRVSLNAPLAFDASIQQLVQLARGRCVCLVPEAIRPDGEALLEHLRRARVDVFDCTPSHLALLLAAGLAESADGPRRVLVGGEAIGAEPWRRMAADPHRRYLNVYGPTECTVDATAAAVTGARPVLGRPLPGVRAHVVERGGAPAAPGVAGELLLGGSGLARGYLGRPAATAERFVPDPFGKEPGARLYRTGDRARRLADGRLEYLGRMDLQVKLRGHRIELGEIEAALAEHPRVRAAAAALRPRPGAAGGSGDGSGGDGSGGDGGEIEQILVAYAVWRGPDGAAAAAPPAAPAELRGFLRDRLPAAMVPSAVVLLDALPLTGSGKVDRARLPAPGPPAAAGAGEPEPPRTPAERLIAGLFEDLLGAPAVGRADGFFDLGGHSLLVVRLLAALEERTGRRLPIAAVFRAPTPAGLAAELEPRAGDGGSLVELRAGGARPPLVWIHPGGGEVLAYAEVARRLGGGRPVLAFRARGLAPGTPPDRSVDAMAAAYLDELTAARPYEPRLLAGWSFGGLVAWEMARRLAARGEPVPLLALIDAPAPAAGRRPPGEYEALALFCRDLGVRPAPADLARLRRELERPGAPAGPPAPAAVLAAAAALGLFPAELGGAELGRRFEVFRAAAEAAAGYPPRRYGGRVLAVAAAGGDRAGAGTGEAWRALAAGPLTVRALAGDHYSLLRPPAAAALAEILTAAIEDTAADD